MTRGIPCPWIPWALFLGDALALGLALFLGYRLRQALIPWFPVTLGPRQYQGLFLAAVVLPLGYLWAGLYPGYGLSPVERLRRRVSVTLLVFGMLLLWEYLVAREGWSRGVLPGALAFALVLPPVAEAGVQAALVRLGRWGSPVVILGAARTGALAARLLKAKPGIGLVPVAFLDDDPATWGRTVEGIPVLGPLSQAPELARQVRTAVVAMPGLPRQRLVPLLRSLPFPSVLVVPDLFGLDSLWVAGRDLGGILALEVRRNLLVARNRLIKRAMDCALGIPLFLASLPLIALAAVLIWCVSPGPVFFTQEREGYRGRRIRIVKLRTMYPDAEERLQRHLAANPDARTEWTRRFKLRHDPRVLPGVGHLLRRTSLDELPQLWNVLKGEMSLVGPRPFPDYHLAAFGSEFRELRRQVRPGLTGLWQVSARSEGDLALQEQLDKYYIQNWSPWLDLYLLARTVGAVLSGRGAY